MILKDFTPKDISEMIVIQNTELGLNLVDACSAIRPLIKRGPTDQTWDCWVCAVRPDIHEKLIKMGRVFVGYDYTQCFRCQKYGHREVHCKELVATCGHCGVNGHKTDSCLSTNDPPKCANCKGQYKTASPVCTERRKAIGMVVKRTSYLTLSAPGQ